MTRPVRQCFHRCVALAFALGAAHAAAAPGSGVYADRIVLGQSAKLSGTGGTQAGRQYRDGLLLAFESANRKGGVHGRRIELVSLDDENDPKKALANVRALIDEHKVFALVGNTFTNPVKAVLPMLREADIPLIAPYTGFPELYDGTQPNVFVMRASFADEMSSIVRHIQTVGYDQIALVHYATPQGEEFRQDVSGQLRAVGKQLVKTGSMPINPKDPAEAVQPTALALAAVCPKLIVLGVSGRDAAALVRAMAGSSCSTVRYLARSLVDIGLLQKELGDNARGVMVTQVVPNPYRNLHHPLVRDYRETLKEHPAKPDFTEMEGYIAGRFVVQALLRAGREIDRPAFVKALESQTLDGPDRYRLRFGSGQRVGTRYVNIVMISAGGRITD